MAIEIEAKDVLVFEHVLGDRNGSNQSTEGLRHDEFASTAKFQRCVQLHRFRRVAADPAPECAIHQFPECEVFSRYVNAKALQRLSTGNMVQRL
jgi:hypothetical protein